MDKQRLNELLAEHVMGWTTFPHTTSDGRVVEWQDRYNPNERYSTKELPDLLTWEGMGMVVKAMKGKGFVEFELSDRGWPDGSWVATFRTETTASRRRWDSMADADEAPIAVGLSALEAIGVSLT